MRLTIRHSTTYAYDQPVDYALQKVRLRPLSSPVQTVEDWDLHITGGAVEASYADHYGNHVDLVVTNPGAARLEIVASGTVETLNSTGVLGQVYSRAPLWHFKQPTPLTKAGAVITDLSKIVADSANSLDGLHALSAAVQAKAPYKIGKTDADTTAEEALEIGFGVCQDHSNIFVSAARLAGLPARYVSGYLMINDRIDQDATHAWAEAHVDGLGWVGFDVSNGVAPDEKYVRIAVGCDAREAAPISGLRMGPATEDLVVSLQVQQ